MSDINYEFICETNDLLTEEYSENLQALSKAHQFGYFGDQPDRPDNINLDELRHEIDDLLISITAIPNYLGVIQCLHEALKNGSN